MDAITRRRCSDQWHNDLISHETLEWNAGPIRDSRALTIGQLGALVTVRALRLNRATRVSARAHSTNFFGRCIFNKQSMAQLGFVGKVGPVCVAGSFISSHGQLSARELETPPILGCN
jgi:hypothetical protein